jgi:thiol-disulfide isomerase/thioredoxin
MNSTASGVAGLALAVVLGFAAVPAAAAPAAKLLQPVEPPFPAPTVPFSDGERAVGLAAFRGRPLLLNIWATWCPPCVKELPALDRLAAALAGELTVVALATDDGGAPQVRPFLERLSITRLTPLYDPQARAFQAFPLRGLPTSYLVDAEGRVIARLEGATEWDSKAMQGQIRRLLAPPPGR